MKKLILLLFICLTSFSIKMLAQDSVGYCDCYRQQDSSIMQDVPFTLGADSVGPPYYYNNLNTTPALKLPFTFCFYGKSYDSVYIGNKGNITFEKPIHTFTSGNFPAGTDTAMIAPFWANANNLAPGPYPPGLGETWYKMYPNRMEVTWYNTKFYRFDCDVYNSFKLTISNGQDPEIPGGNNVEFCYYAMGWACADSSGGSMGFAGVPATIGVNKGDHVAYAQIGRFSLPGHTFSGITSATNGTYWLNFNSFILNTCVTEKNIPPVVLNPGLCDTVTLCPWDTAEYTVSFLCAVPGQRAALTATSPTLGLVLCDTSTAANGIKTINIKAPTNSSVIGYNTINVTATDFSVPPQKITYPIVFKVDVCTGVSEVMHNNDGFSIYPNSNNGIFTVELDKGQTLDNCVVKIYDIQGKEIYSEPLATTKAEINISNQPKGMYFLKLLRDGEQVGAKKISLQ